MATSRLGIRLNLRNNAPSQYDGFDFNSMVEFAGKKLGANEDGIFEILTGDDDNGVAISGFFELLRTDLDEWREKRVRKLYLGGQWSGNMQIGVKFDNDAWTYKTLTPAETSLGEHGNEIYWRRDKRGRYVQFYLGNVSGADFSIDHIAFIPYFKGGSTAGK